MAQEDVWKNGDTKTERYLDEMPEEIVAALIDSTTLHPNILDIGCSTACATHALSSCLCNPNVWGLDSDQERLQEASSHAWNGEFYPVQGNGWELSQSFGEDIQDVFDATLVCNSLSYAGLFQIPYEQLQRKLVTLYHDILRLTQEGGIFVIAHGYNAILCRCICVQGKKMWNPEIWYEGNRPKDANLLRSWITAFENTPDISLPPPLTPCIRTL